MLLYSYFVLWTHYAKTLRLGYLWLGYTKLNQDYIPPITPWSSWPPVVKLAASGQIGRQWSFWPPVVILAASGHFGHQGSFWPENL